MEEDKHVHSGFNGDALLHFENQEDDELLKDDHTSVSLQGCMSLKINNLDTKDGINKSGSSSLWGGVKL